DGPYGCCSETDSPPASAARKQSSLSPSRKKGKISTTRLPNTSARLRPAIRCMDRFHAMTRQSRSNANMPSALASIIRSSRNVEFVSKTWSTDYTDSDYFQCNEIDGGE